MLNLFVANLKSLIRNRQLLFWSLAFPLIFTVIFGFFFGKNSTSAGTVVLINQSKSELATTIESAMTDSGLFTLQKENNLDASKALMKKGRANAIVVIPESFGQMTEEADKKVRLIYDPANFQASSIVNGFLGQFLTTTNYQIQGARPIYSVEEEQTVNGSFNYFSFVLIGLLGMALMNSAVQGLAISMSHYREDKILKRITTTPLASWRFVSAEVLARLVLNAIQVSLILTVGIYAFKADVPGDILLLLLFSLVGAILFQLIGFVVAAFSKTTDAAEGMATAVTIPMMFLAGVFFPIDQLPKWLYSIVQYLPLAPLLRIMREIAFGSAGIFDDPQNLVILFSWIVVALAIASYRFRLTDE